jgi:hypothetical protein
MPPINMRARSVIAALPRLFCKEIAAAGETYFRADVAKPKRELS